MYLKSIEMQGFKSFPDRTVLSFGSGITAVVGPNGSGKSNVADAVRWVLGEQSTKSLRGSKMEDVIFSGTDKRRAVGFAEVTLKLDNKDRVFNRPDNEISVTRRYYRSGESEYKINGEPVRLKDIHELFMDTGLGRDGYSMVSQGKIADMISAKSTERRDMFEEAAGISHYRYRRSDALKKLAEAEENLIRLRDILTELSSRVGPLKQQSEKAQQFLEYAGEKKSLEIGLWLYTIDKTKNDLKVQEDKIGIADAQYKAAESQLLKIEQDIDASISEAQRITVEIDDIRRTSSQLEEQATLIDGQAAVRENSILHNSATLERIERDRSAESDTGKHLDERIEEANAEIMTLEKLIEKKTGELDGISHELDSLSEKSDKSAGEISELSSELSKKSLMLADARVAESTARSSADEIAARLSAIDEAYEGRKPVIAGLTGEKEVAEGELSAIAEKLNGLENSLSGLRMRGDTRRKKLEELRGAQQELTNAVNAAESRAAMLTELEKNMEGYTGSVKAVMRETKRGVLKGIHAPLSQLITVKDRYALAVETALGAQIQYIVTDNETDAKKAINFLKESNAGRATFLPITAIKGKTLNEGGLDREFGYVELASNLVECDEKYREIIVSQLGRTAVAEDMDCAVAISKKYGSRFKIVTLDGQVINAGGSMTGGSRAQNTGMLSRGNEIEKLTEKAKQLAEKLKASAESVKAATEAVAQSEAELQGHEGELKASSEEKIRLEGVLALKEGQLSAMLAAQEELCSEKNTITARRTELLADAQRESGSIGLLGEEVSSLESRITAASGGREQLHQRREELTSAAADVNLACAEARKEIEAKNELIESLGRRGSSHRTRIEELDEEKSGVEAKNEALRAEIERLHTEAQQVRNSSAVSKDKIDELIKSRELCEAESTQKRLLERAKTTEREAAGGELARLEERKASMLKEYDDICAKLFEEYELTRREAEQLNIVIEDVKTANKRLTELRNKIKALGSVNVSAIEEYKEVSERFLFMNGQIEDIEKSKAELTRLIDELTEKMAVRFRERFNEINASFKTTFSELFDGGKASLELEDEHDVLECGIIIRVQPPGKNVQNIDLLSGGEKGLSAISLLFAILKVTPAPFCIFDEVEAALDDVNVSKYAAYVKRMTKNTQFILITHRRGTMDEADMLYGVTMQEEGVSKLLELKTAEMAEKLGLE